MPNSARVRVPGGDAGDVNLHVRAPAAVVH
jgi:hypothetical protein